MINARQIENIASCKKEQMDKIFSAVLTLKLFIFQLKESNFLCRKTILITEVIIYWLNFIVKSSSISLQLFIY